MRIWEGIEKEGAQKGVMTLFVESKRITCAKLTLICRIAKKRNISRIYLGAGKVNVTYMYKRWHKVLGNYDVVIETAPRYLSKLPQHERFYNIVLRNDITISYKNIIPKIDNGKSVALYYGAVENSLKTLKDGIYTDSDTIIQI